MLRDLARVLRVGDREDEVFRLDALTRAGVGVDRLPYSLRILLESLLRMEDGGSVTAADIDALARREPLPSTRTRWWRRESIASFPASDPPAY
ncbi:MAG: hypothetical protein HYU51_04205 [Candidatus Rokubacteria bacterium]|nr:hypothetical protein [Candidatus Rokubacteria bacterium]